MKADSGDYVIAGLKGGNHDPPRAHGHVTVVVSGPLAGGKYPTGYWGSLDDRATWTLHVLKPGNFSVRVNYACENGTAGNEVVIEVAGQSLKAKITGTGTWENYQTAIFGDVELSAGEHRLTVRAAETLKNHLMDLKEVRLVPF